MESQLPVRESTGRNDGRYVEAYQRVTGNRRGDEWCGSFQAAAQQHCGLPFPASAGGSYNWFAPNSPRTVYWRGHLGSLEALLPGYRVGFYSAARGRIAHIGAVVVRTRHGFVTIEGNTGTGTNAGVHRLSRGRGEIYAGANWNY